jgi:hypothetical protein
MLILATSSSAAGCDAFGSAEGSDNFCSAERSDDLGSADGSDDFGSADGSDDFGSADGSDDFGSADGSDDLVSADGSDDFGSVTVGLGACSIVVSKLYLIFKTSAEAVPMLKHKFNKTAPPSAHRMETRINPPV